LANPTASTTQTVKKTSSFLTGFLAMLVAAGLLSSAGTAQAAIVNINIGPTGFNIGGINGGAPDGGQNQVNDFPIPGYTRNENILTLFDNVAGLFTGLQGDSGLVFATGGFVTPVKFSLNDSIGSGSTYSNGDISETAFRYGGTVAPDWASGSYMGFRTIQGNYGWLEVTWTGSSDQFQIFSGAYESTPNVAILAASVPEPSTYALLLMTGSGALWWARRRR
jgi:hypothetical protein